jgi:histidine triad (HIT) family protein
LSARVHDCARAVALALKAAYACDGVSTRQHNEPAGSQDVWHYHLHVFPRYVGDGLYGSQRQPLAAGEHAMYAAKLRPLLRDWKPAI